MRGSSIGRQGFMDCRWSGRGLKLGRSQASIREPCDLFNLQLPVLRVIDVTMLLTFSNSLGLSCSSFLCLDFNIWLECSLAEGGVEVLGDLVDELEGVEPQGAVRLVGAVDADGQILGHVAGLDSLNNDALASLTPVLELFVVVKLGTVEQTAGPGEHGSDGVG